MDDTPFEGCEELMELFEPEARDDDVWVLDGVELEDDEIAREELPGTLYVAVTLEVEDTCKGLLEDEAEEDRTYTGEKVDVAEVWAEVLLVLVPAVPEELEEDSACDEEDDEYAARDDDEDDPTRDDEDDALL
ncbi:hypothetical protein HK405_003592 [Cladochytrium tenue]|nr:hypothetical protein HK405_003592 [Cladochytrium tenue]